MTPAAPNSRGEPSFLVPVVDGARARAPLGRGWGLLLGGLGLHPLSALKTMVLRDYLELRESSIDATWLSYVYLVIPHVLGVLGARFPGGTLGEHFFPSIII